jgi:hypothetical protein
VTLQIDLLTQAKFTNSQHRYGNCKNINDVSKQCIHILIKKKYPLQNSEIVDTWYVQKQ